MWQAQCIGGALPPQGDSPPALAYISRALAVYPSLTANDQQALKTFINTLYNHDNGILWNKFSFLMVTGPDPSQSETSGQFMGGMNAINLVTNSSNFFVSRNTGSHNINTPYHGWSNGLSGDDSYQIYNFNPSTDSLYTTSSAHMSIWINTPISTNNFPIMGFYDGSGSTPSVGYASLSPAGNPATTLFGMNDRGSGTSGGYWVPNGTTTTPNGHGFHLVTRNNNQVDLYWNDQGSVANYTTTPIVPLGTMPFVVNNNYTYNLGGIQNVGCQCEWAMISAGAGFSASDELTLYNATKTLFSNSAWGGPYG